MSGHAMLRPVPTGEDDRLYAAVNLLLAVVLGTQGAQVRLRDYDGVQVDVRSGATSSSGNYPLDVQSPLGLHAAFLLSATAATAAPTTSNAHTIRDAGVLIAATKALVLYGAGGTNNASLSSDANGGLVLGGVGTANGTLSVSKLIAASIGPSAAQQHTLPAVASDTVALLAAAQTLTNKTINGGTLSGTLAGSPTLSGTVTFSSAAPIVLSGTAARLTGPFDDATRGNRPFFQSSATNGDTNVSAMPSGSNTIGKFEAYNSSAPGSATGVASLEANSTEVRLSAAFASGSGLPLQLYAGGVKAVDVALTGAVTLPLQPRVRVFNSATISHTASGSYQTLTFDSERYDVGAFHSGSGSTLTAPSAGSYLIGGTVSFASSAGGVLRGVRLLLNGATPIGHSVVAAAAAVGGTILTVVTAYDLAASDTVALQAFQDSGGNLNLTSVPNSAPEFWAVRYA